MQRLQSFFAGNLCWEFLRTVLAGSFKTGNLVKSKGTKCHKGKIMTKHTFMHLILAVVGTLAIQARPAFATDSVSSKDQDPGPALTSLSREEIKNEKRGDHNDAQHDNDYDKGKDRDKNDGQHRGDHDDDRDRDHDRDHDRMRDFMRVDCRYHNNRGEHEREYDRERDRARGVRHCYASAVYLPIEYAYKHVHFGVGCDSQTFYNDSARVQIEQVGERISPNTAAFPGVEIMPKGALRETGTYESVLDIPEGRLKGICYVHRVREERHPIFNEHGNY
jgi:hypothetical protein